MLLKPFSRASSSVLLRPTLTRSFVNTSFQEKDVRHQGDHYCQIPERGLIELEGPDTAKFLQGLITNHMPKISPGGDGFYTAFLTPPGRMLYDTFIYPVNSGVNFPHPKFMIDCPASNTSTFMRHLKRYILRSKVKARDCSEEYQLWHVWGHHETLDPALVKKERRLSDIGCTDPRMPGFGYRAVLKKEQAIEHILPTSGHFEPLDASEYTIRRMLYGIPEGVDDLWPEISLPLESNLDYMNGVDFRKGCYVGQELTIRTYHTGVVRKRIVPMFSAPSVQSVDRHQTFPSGLVPQTDIKLVEGATLMRLEHVKRCAEGEPVAFTVPGNESIRIRPFLPDWWEEQHGE
ncbi:ccr4 associated factor [Rhizopus stolonifer]|uniref:Ccr4 associated factor n=1 Tax=Rhizopus stolonifer TaxID=4846 RepID=A0A367KRD6_RHIST|nr:ccr4 associated factor [Rhizopus stolonifer]